ncbi:hypothetical protein NM688_g5196 [Phlebia brevispora]|uniref:Uncharacterized protein n=1 Tax=Phlebia brevispora TaxID=194682 RepID=A0ACC1SZ48_9APHY|nr:hypothetical protein NM688_g5196 [Phlebia brevispora]
MFRSAFPQAVLLIIAGLMSCAYAACPSGGVAIGRESVRFTDIIGTQVVYEGIAMNNNCQVLGKTDFLQDEFVICDGEWDASIAVTCTNGVPTQAVEIGGAQLTCSPTTDTSCNVHINGTDPVDFEVIACCV